MAKVLHASFGRGVPENGGIVPERKPREPLGFMGILDCDLGDEFGKLAEQAINIPMSGVSGFTLGDVMILKSVSLKLRQLLERNPEATDANKVSARMLSLCDKKVQELFASLHNCDEERLRKNPTLYFAIISELERRDIMKKE